MAADTQRRLINIWTYFSQELSFLILSIIATIEYESRNFGQFWLRRSRFCRFSPSSHCECFSIYYTGHPNWLKCWWEELGCIIGLRKNYWNSHRSVFVSLQERGINRRESWPESVVNGAQGKAKKCVVRENQEQKCNGQIAAMVGARMHWCPVRSWIRARSNCFFCAVNDERWKQWATMRTTPSLDPWHESTKPPNCRRWDVVSSWPTTNAHSRPINYQFILQFDIPFAINIGHN